MVNTKAVGIYNILGRGKALSELVKEVKFEKPVTVKAVSGTISSFPKLHVQLVLRTKPKDPEGGWIHQFKGEKGVVAALNCGDSGVGNLALSGLNIKTQILYFYFWAHNMNWRSKDFHGSFVIYFEGGDDG